jgi:thiol-disulfide isomerase/thioredoxin
VLVYKILAVLLLLSTAPVQAAPARGDPAPEVIGTTVDGVRLESSQFRGKVLVVTFWATWCGPCMREMPMLESMQRLAGKERLQVVAVNIENNQVFRKVAGKLASFAITVAHDDRKRGSDAYGVNGIPHMVIIGRDGVILKVNRGYSEEALDGILAEINAALRAPAAPLSTPS